MKKLIAVVAISSLLAACQSADSLRHDINVKEEALMQSNARSKSMDSLANVLIEDYDAYATKYPKDSMTPTYLVREGQLYSSKQDYQKAAALFNKVCVQYNSDRWASYALFFQALAYSDMAKMNENKADKDKNIARAKSLLNSFISSYPNHNLIRSATELVEMVGMTEEEMLNYAIAKHQRDSLSNASSKVNLP